MIIEIPQQEKNKTHKKKQRKWIGRIRKSSPSEELRPRSYLPEQWVA